MKKRAMVLVMMMVLAAVALLGGCAKSGIPSTTLRMGTNAQFPPFESMEGSQYVGIDVEIATKLAEGMGLTLEVVDMDFDSLLSALASGKCDIVAAGMTVRPDREEQADFSVSYYEATQMIMKAVGDASITGKDSLVGKKIGAQSGTTGEEAANAIDNAEVVSFPSGLEAVMALNNGQIDAIILDGEPCKNLQKQNADFIEIIDGGFDKEYYAIAVKKGNTELLNKIDELMQTMLDDGSIDEIVTRWTAQ